MGATDSSETRPSGRDRSCIRPAAWLGLLVLILSFLDAYLYFRTIGVRESGRQDAVLNLVATSALGLTDLCLATEARYTRHPAVSDPVVPFMDHPGSFEHFPSGSFWAYPTLPPVRIGS